MRFELNVDCDNDAFQGEGALPDELFSILGLVRRRLHQGVREGNIHDSNGNTVGSFRFVEDNSNNTGSK